MQPPTEVILRRQQSLRRDNDAPNLANGAGNEAHQPFGNEVQQKDSEVTGPASAPITAKAGADLANGREAAQRNGSAAQASARDGPGDAVLTPACQGSGSAEAAAADSSASPYFDARASMDGQ